MSGWKELFPEAIRAFLCEKGVDARHMEVEGLRGALEGLPLSRKRGMWRRIGELAGVDGRQAHNYYFNSFVRRFYDDFLHLRVVMQAFLGRFLSTHEFNASQVTQAFIDTLPGMRLSYHHVMQAFSVYHMRGRYDRVAAGSETPSETRSAQSCMEPLPAEQDVLDFGFFE